MTYNDGGPAFPMPSGAEPRVNATTHYNEGMTLRDWFAGQALATTNPADLNFGTVGKPFNPWMSVAEDCYRAADAMLAARERKETP